MCNCGKKRMNYAARVVTNRGSAVEYGGPGFTKLEYTGKTALTVTGNGTLRTYRFSRPGDVLFVDNRDVGGMTGIAVLKRL